MWFDFMRFLCMVNSPETSAFPSHIVFFDGVCNLCNFSVDFLIRHDKHHKLYFSPLQGTTAAVLMSIGPTTPDSFIYLRNGKTLMESTAAIRVMADLGVWWKWVLIFLLIPPFLRNPLYRWTAKNRYRWFGQKSSCRIPSEQEREKFLP